MWCRDTIPLHTEEEERVVSMWVGWWFGGGEMRGSCQTASGVYPGSTKQAHWRGGGSVWWRGRNGGGLRSEGKE